MATVNLVLFLTVEFEGELQFMLETQESKGHILDADASDRLLDAVCDAVGMLPPGEVPADEVTADGNVQ